MATQLAAAAAEQLARSIGSHATSSERARSAERAPEAGSRERLPAAQIETLWIRLAAIFGHRFTSAYGDDPSSVSGDTWGRALADLSGDQLAFGLRACAMSADPWPPTLPAFRALCLGIPTMLEVERDLNHRQDAFTRLVWARVDAFAFGRADQRQAAGMLERAYESARLFILQGGKLPAISALELEAESQGILPIRPNRSPHAAAMLADLAASFGGEP